MDLTEKQISEYDENAILHLEQQSYASFDYLDYGESATQLPV